MTVSNLSVTGNLDDTAYHALLENMQTYALDRIGTQPVFTTDADVWSIYLAQLPVDMRQYHNCHACQKFVTTYGSLVTIGESGQQAPVFWWPSDSLTEPFYASVFAAMYAAVKQAKVTGVFVGTEKRWGTPVTGIWRHFGMPAPQHLIWRGLTQTASQHAAEKLADYVNLQVALASFSLEHLNTAVRILESDTLYRSEKVLGMGIWLRDLKENLAKKRGSTWQNLLWLAVATAPAGFCHPRSSMIGTLLEDIAAGKSFEVIKHAFETKMRPGNYQRAQVAPTENAIEVAEKLVAKLGIATSLQRRYARLAEIPTLWQPRQTTKVTPDGVFAHVTPRNPAPQSNTLNLPTTTLTWSKFSRTVLPTAEKIEVRVDAARFAALTTAVDPAAPNILQWDNPFSWYYHSGADADIRQRVVAAGGRYENNALRCSLAWDGPTDLDLHCITPTGAHIYFADKRDARGGWLDVDANGGGVTSLTPVENIRWKQAPLGAYRFYVHNYNQRTNGPTPFRVELEIEGRIYTGTGIAQWTGWQTDVFMFRYQPGQVSVVSGIAHTSISAWSLAPGLFANVSAIALSPNLWGQQPVEHAGTHVFFLLQDCQDTSEGRGRGFFVEHLKSELREIRKTLEAYTAATPIEGAAEADACGVGYSQEQPWNLTLRVTRAGLTQEYKIDRWD